MKTSNIRHILILSKLEVIWVSCKLNSISLPVTVRLFWLNSLHKKPLILMDSMKSPHFYNELDLDVASIFLLRNHSLTFNFKAIVLMYK